MSAGDVCRGHGCAACCYDTEMLLMEEDLRRLEARGHRRDDFSEVDADGLLVLKNVEAGDGGGRRHCYFLRNDLCTVYEHRPAGCRLYPFVLDASARFVQRDADCPHRREFPNDPAAGRRLRVAWGTLQREAVARAKRMP